MSTHIFVSRSPQPDLDDAMVDNAARALYAELAKSQVLREAEVGYGAADAGGYFLFVRAKVDCSATDDLSRLCAFATGMETFAGAIRKLDLDPGPLQTEMSLQA